ncbi:MAG TPA: MFS transporter [Solirubrobacteraceae bacterium]|jgi:MFS family permease
MLRSNPSLRRVLAAWLQSCLGTGAGYVALLLLTLRSTGSSWTVSAVLLADFLPAVVFGAYFGHCADRYSRRALIVGGNLIQAAAFAGLAFSHTAVPIVLLAFVAGIGSALMRPALRAALPAIAGDAQQTAAAVFDTCRWIGITIGPLFAATLFYVSSVTLTLALNAASFVVAAAILATVSTGSTIAASVDEDERSSLREGLAVAFGAPGVGVVIACSSGVVIAGGLLNVCEPLFATGVLHGSGSAYALLVGAYGVGMVVASSLVVRRGDAPGGVLARRYVGALLLTAVGMGGSAVVGSVALAALSFGATGYANALSVVSETQLIQIRVPNRVQGRLFGARDMVEGVFLLAGFVGAPALVAAGGVRFAIAVGASVCAGCTIVAAGLMWATDKQPDAVAPLPADEPPLIRRFDPRLAAEPAIIASEATVHAAPPAS